MMEMEFSLTAKPNSLTTFEKGLGLSCCLDGENGGISFQKVRLWIHIVKLDMIETEIWMVS